MVTDKITDRGSVPKMVRAGISRNGWALVRAAQRLDRMSPAEFADYLAYAAKLHEREARWWGVLERWFQSPEASRGVEVFGSGWWAFYRAVLEAQGQARKSGRESQELEKKARVQLAAEVKAVAA